MQGLTTMGTENRSWYSDLTYNKWIALSPSGLAPLERYKHAATISDDKLYIIGGSHRGRYLSDFQVLDLKTLIWSAIKLKTEATDKDGSQLEVFPETSGPSMIKWKNKLLLLAGFTRSTTYNVTVRYIDLESYNCGVIETFGDIPVSRRGQSVTLFCSKLIMFGGEDLDGRLLNDVHILDLKTMTWSVVETTQNRPTPRYDHVAALQAERYLYIFGGCSCSTFSADLHILDLERMEWSQPFDLVKARAGHAGVSVDGNWYIVGSKSGAVETLVVNMSTLVVSVLTTVNVKDPLASEGLNISSITLGGDNFLITFGGYNEKYFNEVFAMRLKPAVAASTTNTTITIKQMNGSDYAKMTTELLRTHQQLARNFQVRDFVVFNKELTPVPETQLALLPSPIDHENLEIVGTSTEGGKTRAYWSKVEDETLSKSFMAISAELEPNSKKGPSFWGHAAKLYNESKPAYVSRRTSDVMRSHWHDLKKKVYNFNAIYKSLQRECESSHNADEIMMLAKVKHGDVYKCGFNLEHVWRIVKDHPVFNSQAIDVPVCSKEVGCRQNSPSNQEVNAASISGQKRNEEGMTKSDTEQIPVQKKVRASNPSSNQDTNAGDGHTRDEEGTTKSNTEQLLVQTSAVANNSLSNQDANASTNPNEGDAQIIEEERNETGDNAEQMVEKCSYKQLKLEYKKAKVEAMKAMVEAKNRELWLKECEILWKDTSQMTDQQRVIHAKACEIITRRWNSENV